MPMHIITDIKKLQELTKPKKKVNDMTIFIKNKSKLKIKK
jgi:hypothetical protein